MGARTPFPRHSLHPCWMSVPSAGQGEAAGSLAEFSPQPEHGQPPWKQRRSPPTASPLLQTFVRSPSSGNRGSLGSSPVAITALRASLPFPHLLPALASPAGRSAALTHGMNFWGGLRGTSNSGRKHRQLLKNPFIPAAAGSGREPGPGEQLAAALRDYCSPQLGD